MELIENIVWAIGGFITTLVTMELAWKLAGRHTKSQLLKARSDEARGKRMHNGHSEQY
jgi:hypothetical protein